MGCEATLVQKQGEQENYDRKHVLDVPIDDNCLPERNLANPAKVLEAIQRIRYKRGVPRDRARKELYHMLMEWEPNASSFFSSIMNVAWNALQTIGTWELAAAVQLDKHNGKESTLGVRLIMMLDPPGKAYYWLIHGHTKEIRSDFGYGFYELRRREQARGRQE